MILKLLKLIAIYSIQEYFKPYQNLKNSLMSHVLPFKVSNFLI
jgi:hypothetical protein